MMRQGAFKSLFRGFIPITLAFIGSLSPEPAKKLPARLRAIIINTRPRDFQLLRNTGTVTNLFRIEKQKYGDSY